MDLGLILRSFDNSTLASLYASHWTCQAVVRILPPLAKQYVLRLLFSDGVPERVVESWATPDAEGAHRDAILTLTELQLMHLEPGDDRQVYCVLGTGFRDRLRAAMTPVAVPDECAIPQAVWRAVPSAKELQNVANSRWEGLQLFLVGSARKPPALPVHLPGVESLQVPKLLAAAGLLASESKNACITDGGFHFLLMDTYSQLWMLLREYIAQAEKRSSSELVSVMSFLLQLGFRQVGQPVRLSELPPHERTIAAHMAQIGLVAVFEAGGELWFCPTPMAATLCAGASRGAHDMQGYIVVETNFRVYAYTDSEIQVAILQLFCRRDAQMPNLFVGTLTRESVTHALEVCGISADQIVEFLNTHTHPNVLTRKVVVPEAVSDQIKLWEMDANRVQRIGAVLYDDFDSRELYQVTLKHAKEIDALLWYDDASGRLVGDATAHDRMRGFIKSAKERGI